MADGRDSYIRKGVYQRFVLGVSELRKLKSIVKEQGNGRCPLGMLYASLCYTCSATPRRVSRANHIHIGVGFCVVRSTMEGNAKAQIRGTATVQTPALFRIYAQHFSIKTFPARGVCRKQRKTNMEVAIENWKYPFISERAKSWMQKAESCETDTTGAAMDGFIASYIAYAAWVSLFELKNPKGQDRYRCVNQAKRVLSKQTDITTRLDTPARELAQAITRGCFDVTSLYGRDPELDKKWGTTQGLHALLSTLYNMRCNLFHGQKSMEQEQIAILKPAIACMKILNEALAQIFEEEFDRY